MSKLNMTLGRDFNFVFAGTERLFLKDGFKELDLNEFLLDKFMEPVNGGKRMLFSLETDGLYRRLSYLGPASEARRILEERKNGSREKALRLKAARDGSAPKEEQQRVQASKALEGAVIDDSDSYTSSRSSARKRRAAREAAREETVPETPSAPPQDDSRIVRIPRFLSGMDKKLDLTTALPFLLDVMNSNPDCVVAIDARIYSSLAEERNNESDMGWLRSFFNNCRTRSFSADNSRAAVLLVFKSESSPEDFRERFNPLGGMTHETIRGIPEFDAISSLALTIRVPNTEDLKNLTFKRLMQYAPDQISHVYEFTEMLCQAISEPTATGIRTLDSADKMLKTMLGMGGCSAPAFQKLLALGSVRGKKTWSDMVGGSARSVKEKFDEIKKTLTMGKRNDPSADPTFCYRSDEEHKAKLNFIPHFLLMGEPGTGKTTMANIMAKEFFDMGLIKSDRAIVVNLGERISQPNHSWVYELFEIEGRDRLIFVDEIESAIKSAKGDWGEENVGGGDAALLSSLQVFVTKMLSVATDSDSGTILCLAGYKRGVNEFLKLDDGLPSRFPTTYVLEGYDGKILLDIAKKRLRSNGQDLDYDQKVQNRLSNMFDVLHSALDPQDVGTWANARTAETIADAAYKNYVTRITDEDSADKTDLVLIDDFMNVVMQIGSRNYALKEYIPSDDISGNDPIGDIERNILGVSEIASYLRKMDSRIRHGLRVTSKRNIAIICESEPRDLLKVIKGICRYYTSAGLTKRSAYTVFNRQATMSYWRNQPTVLTDNQFNSAEGGIIVLMHPTYLSMDNQADYREQTAEIIRRTAEISVPGSDSAAVVVATEREWGVLKRSLPKFTDLFAECAYTLESDDLKTSALTEALTDIGFLVEDSFREAVTEGLSAGRVLKCTDTAIDSLFEDETALRTEDGRTVLDGGAAPYFLEDSLEEEEII